MNAIFNYSRFKLIYFSYIFYIHDWYVCKNYKIPIFIKSKAIRKKYKNFTPVKIDQFDQILGGKLLPPKNGSQTAPASTLSRLLRLKLYPCFLQWKEFGSHLLQCFCEHKTFCIVNLAKTLFLCIQTDGAVQSVKHDEACTSHYIEAAICYIADIVQRRAYTHFKMYS